MRIALVHDYLSEFGGAERVLLALHEIWPKAPIYTAFCKKNSAAGKAFGDAQIIESWLAPVLKFKNLFSPLRFLAPLIWKSFDLKDYDVVMVSSSWYITRGFRVRPKTKVFCYCHTPPRYLYGYPTSVEWQRYWPIRVYALIVNHFLRQYDYKSAREVDEFIANSENVRRRVKKFYRREATVIYPPVEIGSATGPVASPVPTSRRDASGSRHPSPAYFLCVSRLARPKNIDLAIKTCNQLGCGLPFGSELRAELWVVGCGKEEGYLKSIAGSTIKFLGQVGDKELAKIYASCKAFLALAEDEDFGITPVEAMAAGKPVIAFRGGGYLETVVQGKTGLFFDELTVESLVEAIKRLDKLDIKPADCMRRAQRFSKERFKREIKEFVKKRLGTGNLQHEGHKRPPMAAFKKHKILKMARAVIQ